MLDGILIILAILAIICVPGFILVYGIKHFETRTQITGLIILTLASLGFGVVYNSLRFLVFQYFGTLHEFIDILSFQVTIFLSLTGFYAAFRIVSILGTQSGHKLKQDSRLRFLYLFVMFVISGLNILTFQQTDTIASGFYAYQMHSIVFCVMLGFYVPLFFLIIYKAILMVREIKSRPLIKETVPP